MLMKAVLQAIPSYCMNSFLLPLSLGEEIYKMMKSFWWGTSGRRSKGIKWLAWEKLAVDKDQGGIGFRNLYDFNLALQGKQGCKFISNSDALVSKIFKAKYFFEGGFFGFTSRPQSEFYMEKHPEFLDFG